MAPSVKPGKPYSLPESAVRRQQLGSFSPAGKTPLQRAEGRATAEATRERHPVVVAGLTTQTEQVTASPDGMLTMQSYPMPVRVQRGANWVPVDTDLRPEGGALSASALPGDWVRFSPGGRGLMAEIGTGRASLALWWPVRLPKPRVSGPTAAYPNALPGVTLVLTAQNGTAGGFSEVLIVSSARAAREVASLNLRVTAAGTRLADAKGGGLVAPLASGGAFVLSAAAMWDSGTSPRGLAARASAIGSGGVGQVASGGVAVSSAQGPGRYAVVAPVGEQSTDGGNALKLVPDARMLTSPVTRFPVDISAGVFSLATGTAVPAPAATASAAKTGAGERAALAPEISPSLNLNTNGGGTLADYDPVQSGSGCTGSHWNSKLAVYYDSPVGYDNYQAGSCQDNDTDYALYRVGVSSALARSGVTIYSATVDASIAYSSSCSDSSVVTLTEIGSINSGTGWKGPGEVKGSTTVNKTYPPDDNGGSGNEDKWSCNDYEQDDDGLVVQRGFALPPADYSNLPGASAFTFRLSETESDEVSDDVYHVQFTNGENNSDGPYLQVEFFYTPSAIDRSAMNDATSAEGTSQTPEPCEETDGNGPALRPTQDSGGVYLGATATDPDNASTLDVTFRYFPAGDVAEAKTVTVTSSPPYQQVWAEIPETWLDNADELTNGEEIGWDVMSSTGTYPATDPTNGPYSSNWSGTCYFADYYQAFQPPVVTPDGFTQSQAQKVGSTIRFSIEPSGDDPNPVQFYYFSLDADLPSPSSSGDLPGSQTCSTYASLTPDCVINSSGDATLSLVVPPPGPHLLHVEELDSVNLLTTETDVGLPSSGTDCQHNDVPGCAWAGYTFTGAADTPPQPYTSGSSLAANFSQALASGYAASTLISNSGGFACSATGGDGSGDYFDAAQLSAAGWASAGSEMTVDGASFALPSYGSCGTDNILAAGQTIGTGSGEAGSALVFLATSTDGSDPDSEVGVPAGTITGESNGGDDPLASDDSVPPVLGGTAVTGANCLEDPEWADASCVPDTGTITYAAGCSGPTTVDYSLAVPDWESGPADEQAITTADEENYAGGRQAGAPKIYAYAVPLDSNCSVQSVTLPDVGDSVYGATATGDGVVLPALHIFGLSIRNTTTADPEVSGTSQSEPSGQAWTGIWENPIEDAYSASGQGNETIRIGLAFNSPASAGATIPAGSTFRIRLSDPGFLDGDGDGPIVIGDASVGQSYYEAAIAGDLVPVTFGGSSSVTIPAGGDVYSDPFTMTSPVSTSAGLLVSLYIENASLAYLPLNPSPAASGTWYAAPGTGDKTSNTDGTPFESDGGGWLGNVPLLTGVDVVTPAPSPASPGAPTVVVAGNNVTDAWSSSALSDSISNPSQRLAGQIYSQGAGAGYGVVDAGIQSNQVLTDGAGEGGISLLARLDHDVLAEPDVGTVVINEGLEDLLQSAAGRTWFPASAAEATLDSAYAALASDLAAWGINVIVTTLTPCDGYDNTTAGDSCTATVTDPARVDVNDDLLGQGSQLPTSAAPCVADVDALVSNGGSPQTLIDTSTADYDAGDHVNLSFAGYAAMAAAFYQGTTAPDLPSSTCALKPASPG